MGDCPWHRVKGAEDVVHYVHLIDCFDTASTPAVWLRNTCTVVGQKSQRTKSDSGANVGPAIRLAGRRIVHLEI